ncbi:MAG: ribokinase [Dehalococcoidia bacterium]|nr:ribokinase [Dehalococcoidia bacterium]
MSGAETPVIVVLGGINMDLVGTTDRMPAPGETVFGQAFHTAPGGKGANQAVAAARLGAEVRMVGRVGRDEFGPVLLDGMSREGINVSGVVTDPVNSSGIAMILLDGRKENYIVAIYGANLACDYEQIKAVEVALDGADVLLMQLETPLEVATEAARVAKGRGVRVVWDPAPALEMGRDAYALCDVLTPNQVEAEYLSGIPVTDPDSARDAAVQLVGEGVSACVVTMAEAGAFYSTVDSDGFVPAYEVEIADTVAAGDAFTAALGVALAEGRSLNDAVRYASASGALAVTKSGAQEAMPYRREVDALFYEG